MNEIIFKLRYYSPFVKKFSRFVGIIIGNKLYERQSEIQNDIARAFFVQYIEPIIKYIENDIPIGNMEGMIQVLISNKWLKPIPYEMNCLECIRGICDGTHSSLISDTNFNKDLEFDLLTGEFSCVGCALGLCSMH